MTQHTNTKNFSKHEWRCELEPEGENAEFLNGRFKLKAWFDGCNLNYEWSPIEPWKRKMTPKVRKKFASEYDLFISILLRDWAKIIDNKVLFVDPETGGSIQL